MKQKIITLCGSARFQKEFDEVNFRLSKEGHIVISIVPIPKTGVIPELKNKLCYEVHLKKIDISDAIFIINKDGYMGTSTEEERRYATNKGKEIMSLEPIYENQKLRPGQWYYSNVKA